MSKYVQRVADEIPRLELSATGVVLVEGATRCGKTTACEQVARSVFCMTKS